ncbi:MAG: hypothetical protein Q4B96_04210 [Bacillota bacterium]|nr:hypothetical protein [Bacillota bacterium]
MNANDDKALRLSVWRNAAAALLFPRRYCFNCGCLLPAPLSEPALCPDCRARLADARSCLHCATFLEDEQASVCNECLHERPPFAAAFAALPYAGRLRDNLLDLKYRDKTGRRHGAGELLYLAYLRHYADKGALLLTAVPGSPSRTARRGYDHAQLLARELAMRSGLPLDAGLLERVKDTPPLAALSRSERAFVLKGAIRANEGAAGQSVLLIDDIYTSGATTSACAQALLKQQAAAVYVLTVSAGVN